MPLTLALLGRRIAPHLAPRATAGQVGIALPDQEKARLWIEELGQSFKNAEPARLRAIIAQGEQLLQAPDLERPTRARVHLVVSGSYAALGRQEGSTVTTGPLAFEHCARAYELAPGLDYAARAYGRTLAALGELGWAKRTAVELGLGISVKTESRRAMLSLAAFPEDALAQLTRRSLARQLGDEQARREAEAALARLPAEARERAEAEIAADARGSAVSIASSKQPGV